MGVLPIRNKRPYPMKKGMPSGKRMVIGAFVVSVLVFGLIGFFDVPTVHVDVSGRAYFLGQAINPPPTGLCASFGCHCLADESLSMWLFGRSYIKVGGCP